jgi:hypothetical protein
LMPSIDKSLDNNKPEGPPPIITTFVLIKINPQLIIILNRSLTKIYIQLSVENL